MAILKRARAQGHRVLLGGLYGNYTISWKGWSQTVSHLLRGRLFLAFRQWQLYYRSTADSRWVALRKLLLEPLVPARLGDWADRWRRPRRVAPLAGNCASVDKVAAHTAIHCGGAE